MRVAHIVGTFAVAAATSGCILEAQKPDLALDTPDAYLLAARNRSHAAPPALDWWRSFHSPELVRLVQQAQVANFDIAVAIAQIKQADAQVRIAGAPLLPSVDFLSSATAAHSAATGAANSVGGTGGTNSTLFSGSLSASYVLDFWGKNQSTLVAAEESATASRYNREVVTLTAITTVANTYFQVLSAEDRLRIARNNVKAAGDILDLIKKQKEAGTTSQINVAQQESLVETVRATIPPLEQTRQQELAALAVLVGQAPERFHARSGSIAAVAVPRPSPGLPSELLNQRPDLRQAEATLAASNYNVQAARAAFFPSIQLTGNTGFSSSALSSLFGPSAWFYTAAASLTQPVFDGFLLEGQLQQQLGLREQNLQLYRKAVLAAFSDVEQALISLEQTTLQERYQTNVVRASQEAYDLSKQLLEQGTANLVTLLQVEQTLFQAEDNLAIVQLSRRLAAVSLYQALGGGWSPPGVARDASGGT